MAPPQSSGIPRHSHTINLYQKRRRPRTPVQRSLPERNPTFETERFASHVARRNRLRALCDVFDPEGCASIGGKSFSRPEASDIYLHDWSLNFAARPLAVEESNWSFMGRLGF
jgi:hypothetical protein